VRRVLGVDSVVASRWTIEQARGVLVATCGVDANTALELLVQVVEERNIKVRELAASASTGA
jgi:AmiR/NasT family two-component response regulator